MREAALRTFKVTVYQDNGKSLKELTGLSRYGAKKVVNRLGKTYHEQTGFYITLEEEGL